MSNLVDVLVRDHALVAVAFHALGSFSNFVVEVALIAFAFMIRVVS